MRLRGGQTYRTEDESRCAKVVSGNLLVYILPYRKGIPGKKLYLCTVSEGECIPFLKLREGELCWNFQFMALEQAELEIFSDSHSLAAIRKDFARRNGVWLLEESDFQEEMVEKYNLAMMKEEAYVYASAKERLRSIDNCRTLLEENLAGQRAAEGKRNEGFLNHQDVTYQAAAFLCKIQGYEILPFEKLKERFPRGMDIFQIASACGLPARKIRLEPGWQKKDLGTFLGYRKASHVPVVFFQRGGRYRMYDAGSGETKRAGKVREEEIEPGAVMLYRPFASGPITLKKLFLFGILETKVSSWIAAFFLTVLGAFAALLLPQSYEYLTQALLPEGNLGWMGQFALMIFLCMTGYVCITFVKNLVIYGKLNQVQNAVMAAVYDRLMHLPESLIRRYDSADLAQRGIKIAEIFREALREIIAALISLIFAVIFGIRIFAYDLRIGAGLLVSVLLFSLAFSFLCKSHMKAERAKQKEEGELNSLMFQFLCGIQKIRTDGMEDRALYEYLKRYTKMCRIELRQSRDVTWIDMLSKLYLGITLLVLFLFYTGENAGAFVGLFAAAELFSQSVADAASSVLQADFLLPIYDRGQPILESDVESQEGDAHVGKLEGSIEASNVSFSYNQEEGSVLEGINFKVNAGEYVGIVGPSGCRKSTLFQILLGFERPKKGCVFYDHKDLEQISKLQLRKRLGVVLQDESLFTGSIYENISAAVPDMSLEQAWKLLEEVGLKEEVEQMPMGLHTLVTESGNTISGGQRQRILLARALAGRPSVLFLDEATSALDNQMQSQIIKMLEKKRMTRIVIAHRVHTVRKCSRIFVMEQGRIAETGTYEELLERKGIFYELAKRQMAFWEG